MAVKKTQTTRDTPDTTVTSRTANPRTAEETTSQRGENTEKSTRTKKADLAVWRVHHEGHDRQADSLVAASSEAQAVDLLKERLADFELLHAQGPIRAVKVDNQDLPQRIQVTNAGVIEFDLGHGNAR